MASDQIERDAQETHREFVTIAEAAEIAGCSESVVRRAIMRGDVRAAFIGAKYLMRPADLWVLLQPPDPEPVPDPEPAPRRRRRRKPHLSKGRRKAPPVERVVYLVQRGVGGPIKIGRSSITQYQRRLVALQTGSAEPLTLIALLPDPGTLEEAMHEHFAAHRLIGEWFEPVEELLAYAHDPRRLDVRL